MNLFILHITERVATYGAFVLDIVVDSVLPKHLSQMTSFGQTEGNSILSGLANLDLSN